MNRRQLLANAGSLSAAMMVNSITPLSVRAAQVCSPAQWVNGVQVRSCSAGFDIRSVTALQECDQWCWAACIQTAFKLSGYSVSQRRIVKKLFGSSFQCRPAIGLEIGHAIEGQWESDNGRSFFAFANTHVDVDFGIVDPWAIERASRYLAQSVPVIIGAAGHATLLTGMSWIENSAGQYSLTEMIVRDPWPSTPNRRRFTNRELNSTTYMAAVEVLAR